MLGIAQGTLNVQARRGRLRARKVGHFWTVQTAEIERYRREVLGKAGWPTKAEPFLAPAVAAAAPAVVASIRAEVNAPAFCPAPKPPARKRRKVSAE